MRDEYLEVEGIILFVDAMIFYFKNPRELNVELVNDLERWLETTSIYKNK